LDQKAKKLKKEKERLHKLIYGGTNQIEEVKRLMKFLKQTSKVVVR